MSVLIHDRPAPPPSRAQRWTWAVADSSVMIGRGLRHTMRNGDALIMSVVLPLMLLLLFVYVFGGAIDVGTEYINYVVPGIILLAAGFGAATTAVGVTNDMTTGVIDRFRSLPIASWTVVLGHVVASMARNLFATGLVLSVAVGIGFRPSGSLLDWILAIGMISLFILMMTAVSVMFGLIARSADAASGFTFFILFLPYISSAFVPTETMPSVLHGFAENQPITPIIETVRALLMDTPVGDSGWLALVWCTGILLIVMPVSSRLFRRRTST